MMWWNDGAGFGMGWGMWLVLILGTIGFWLLVAFLVRLVMQGRTEPRANPPEPTPMQLLDERLARGEIGPDEYQQTKRLLTQGH